MNSVKNKAELRVDFQAKLINLDVWQSCLNCLWWQRDTNKEPRCEKFSALPPPHVIVNGCRDYEADIPF